MKKLLLLQLAVLVSMGSLVACGGWKQDPLADAGGLGKGQGKPDTKQDKPTLPADYILMDAALFKLVKEGEKVEIKVDARVILPGYSLLVEVKNLSQFSGATFDASTNTFEWTPPIGTASEEISEFSLEFLAIATKPGDVTVARSRVTKVGVARSLLEPTIVEVGALDSEIREGSYQSFYVKVEDRTAGPAESNFPSLIVRNSNSYPSLASFVEVGEASLESPNIFEFKVEVDLSKAEITKNRSRLGFEILPVSKFQKAGPAQDIVYDVLNNPADVVSTWTEEITAAPGAKIDYQFLVFDPKDEGRVNLDSVFSVPKGATLTCHTGNLTSVLACRFVWDVPMTAKGSASAAATFINSSTDYYDNYENSDDLYFQISIGSAGGN